MTQIGDFQEVDFPLRIALGASGGPVRQTEIVQLGSGHEQRNARWSGSRRRYDAGFGVRSLDDLYTVLAFFEARMGRLVGFRFRDALDHKSCAPGQSVSPFDQEIGTGDDATATFQLAKSYETGSQMPPRLIRKPVANNVRVAVNGMEVTAGDEFSVDPANGIVTFAAASIPAAGEQVTAGFVFDVPARFDADSVSVNRIAFEAGEIPSIPIMELFQ